MQCRFYFPTCANNTILQIRKILNLIFLVGGFQRVEIASPMARNGWE